MKNTKGIRKIIATIGVIVVCTALGKYMVRSAYRSLIHMPGLIAQFRTAAPSALPQLKDKYGIDYILIRRNKIIVRSDPRVASNLELIPIHVEKSPGVMRFTVEQNLEAIEPYVFFNSGAIYLMFPLVFEQKSDSFLIIKRIV